MKPDVHHALSALSGASGSVPSIPPPKRRWLARVGVPAGVVLTMGALLAYAARETLIPAPVVPTVRALAIDAPPDDATATGPAGAARTRVSVQAPGWVEPDPYPIFVPALAGGVLEHVAVLDGERVEAGQVIARLVSDDARLAAKSAAAEMARREAELAAAQAHWENPVALERAVSVSQAMLDESRAAYAELEAEITRQQAVVDQAQDLAERLQELTAEIATARDIEQATLTLAAETARLAALEKRREVIDAKSRRYNADLHAATRDIELRIDQRRAIARAEAELDAARAAYAEAELRLERMNVVSPASGIVMNLLVAPGAKVMADMDSPHSAHVVHLYDPTRLQVRVDVPISEAAKIGLDQPANVVVDVLPDTGFRGRVTRFVHQADIGKNTVQVKVAIEDPSPLLKPDMLARVKFLATGSAADSRDGGGASALRITVPESAVARGADGPAVWVIHPETSRLERRAIEVRGTRDGGRVVVHRGVNPGDLLVDRPGDGLRHGRRVRPMNTDQSI